MIELPNGCRMSKPQVHPLNWQKFGASTKKDWYIHYRFYDPSLDNDPKYRYGYLRVIKGMNFQKNLEKRRFVTRAIITDEIVKLKLGYNPITGIYFNPKLDSRDLCPTTPFIKALWVAVEKVNAVPNHLIDMKCVIRGVEKAAIELNISDYPVFQVTRKYIKLILEKCGQLNPRWSARRHNVYRQH